MPRYDSLGHAMSRGQSYLKDSVQDPKDVKIRCWLQLHTMKHWERL